MIDVDKLFTDEEHNLLGVGAMNQQQREALKQFAVRMVSVGSAGSGEIQEIKYNGRLVILDDGSRWEVDEFDAMTSEMWMEMDRVVVIDGEMYKLDDSEKVSVEEE